MHTIVDFLTKLVVGDGADNRVMKLLLILLFVLIVLVAVGIVFLWYLSHQYVKA